MKPTAVGLYVSAGGFSAGMRQNLDILAHLGDGEFGYDTLMANFPSTDYYSPFESWPLDRLKALGVDVMYCAPPCAPWSAGGGQGKKLDSDPRVKKVGHVLEAGWHVEPMIWVMESVCGFPKKSPDLIEMMSAAWQQRGYNITHFYTNYLLHGLPQNRNRYHFIASKIGLWDPPMEIPDRLPVVADVLPPDKPAKWEVFEPSEFRRHSEIISRHVPPGHRVRKVFRDLAGLQDGEPGGPSFNMYRLRPEYPASTMISSPRQIHPNGKRLVTVREAKAISGYPEDFIVEGKTQEKRYRELGKGVLPPMGDFLSRWFALSLARPRRSSRSPQTFDYRDQARALLRQKPRPHVVPRELYGSMPQLKAWYGSHRRWEDDFDDEDEA